MQLSNHSFCRLCAGSFDRSLLTMVDSSAAREQKLDAMIKQYMPFQVIKGDNLPQSVCDSCKMNLKLWHTFVTSCEEAQGKLQQIFNATQSKEITVNNIPRKDTGTVQHAKNIVKPSISSPRTSVILSSAFKKRKSSNYCVARWCNTGNYQGVTLFRFPKDKNRALEWLAAAERTDLKNMTYLHCYYLCGNHFAPNMFTNRAHNQLIRKAIPSIFPRPRYADKIALKAAEAKILPTQLQGMQLKRILPKTESATSGERETEQRSSSTKNASILGSTSSCISSPFESTSQTSSNDTNSIIQLISAGTSSVTQTEPIVPESIVQMINSSENSNNTNVSDRMSPVVHLIDTDNSVSLNSSSSPSVQIFSVANNDTIQLFGVGDVNTQEQIPGEAGFPVHYLSSGHGSIIKLVSLPQTDTHSTLSEAQVVQIDEDVSEGQVQGLISEPPDVGQISYHENEQDHTGPHCQTKLNDVSVTNDSDVGTPYMGLSGVMLNAGDSFVDTTTKQIMDMCSFQAHGTVSTAQDLLLPHLMDKVDKPVSSFLEQAHSLGCDLSQDATHVDEQPAEMHGISVASHLLDQRSAQNSAHNIMFDLQSEDTRDGSVYANHIENLDELMDLDHIFRDG